MHLVHVVHAPCTWCMCMCIMSMCMVHAHICAPCKWCTCIKRTVHKHHAHIAYAARTYREFRVFFGLSLESIWGQSGIIPGSIWDHVGFNAPAKKTNERRAFSGKKTNEKHTKLLYIYIYIHTFTWAQDTPYPFWFKYNRVPKLPSDLVFNHGPNENHEGDEGHREGRWESHD
jgi:hypothetical protein